MKQCRLCLNENDLVNLYELGMQGATSLKYFIYQASGVQVTIVNFCVLKKFTYFF